MDPAMLKSRFSAAKAAMTSSISSDRKLIIPATIAFILSMSLYASICLLAREKLRSHDVLAQFHESADPVFAASGGTNRTKPMLSHGHQFYTAGRARFLNVKHRDIDWSAEMPRKTTSWFSSTTDIPMLVHFAHHKTGTAWFSRVFQLFALRSRRTFKSGGIDVCEGSPVDICQVNNAALGGLELMRSAAPDRGSLRVVMSVRDPRDIAVSAYFYHKVSSESWLHMPRAEFDGRSLQQVLNSSSKSEGIKLEIDMMTGGLWDNGSRGPYATVLEDLLKERSTDFALVKYEDLWAAEQRQLGRGWSSIGYWYGIRDPWENKLFALSGIKAGQEAAAYKSSARNALVAEDTGKDHFRRGIPGDWRRHMTRANKDYARQKLGQLLVDLGYEKSLSW